MLSEPGPRAGHTDTTVGSAAEPDGRAGPSRARGPGAGAGTGAGRGSHRGPRWAGGPRSRPGVLGAARAPGRRGARGAGLWRDGQRCGQSEGSAARCCPIGSEGRPARAVAAGGDWGARSPRAPPTGRFVPFLGRGMPPEPTAPRGDVCWALLGRPCSGHRGSAQAPACPEAFPCRGPKMPGAGSAAAAADGSGPAAFWRVEFVLF